MRLLKLTPILLSLFFVSPAFSEEDHDHDHDHDAAKEETHHEEESNLLVQLGFEMVTAESRQIDGREVLAIPISAVFHENGKSFVIAQNDKRPHNYTRWKVVLGESHGSFVEAVSGVFPGDKMIAKIRPLFALEPGDVVKAKEKVNEPVNVVSKPSVPAPVETVSVPKPTATGKKFGVQIGAFSKELNAKQIANQLKAKFGQTDVLVSESNGKPLYRVRVGQYPTLKNAKDTKEKLKTTGFPGAFVVAIK